MKRKISSKELKEATLERLRERDVNIEDIAQLVYDLQVIYNDKLSMELCIESVDKVLTKREIQHAILVGIELDVLAEKKLIREPLLSIIESDEGLFGVDEILAIGSVYGYGSIALTTFGYLDKCKVGIIKEIDRKKDGKVNTFLDDIVAAIAAASAGRIAHHCRDLEDELIEKNENTEQINDKIKRII
ncbi:MAG: phosphatidylglycerophosphatase A [Vulcanibacillus sp.]